LYSTGKPFLAKHSKKQSPCYQAEDKAVSQLSLTAVKRSGKKKMKEMRTETESRALESSLEFWRPYPSLTAKMLCFNTLPPSSPY